METLKIDRFKLSYLRNMEFTLVVPRLISIVDNHNPESLGLAGRLNIVKRFLPDLDRMEAQERRWNEAAQLDECERSRDSMVNLLIRTERMYARAVVPGYEDASEKLTALFDKHKRDIAADNVTSETQRIYNLAEDIERTPGMLEALNTLALLPAYHAMKEANNRFEELWRKRNRELSEKDQVDSKAIRSACTQALNSLYDAIDFLASEQGESFRPLILEINQLSAYYKQRIKARITYRKKTGTPDTEIIKPEETEQE
jgi:hypothetical protein